MVVLVTSTVLSHKILRGISTTSKSFLVQILMRILDSCQFWPRIARRTISSNIDESFTFQSHCISFYIQYLLRGRGHQIFSKSIVNSLEFLLNSRLKLTDLIRRNQWNFCRSNETLNIFLDTNKSFHSSCTIMAILSSKPDRGKARKNFLAFLKVMGLLWVECKLAFLSSITYKKRYSNEFLKAKQSRYVWQTKVQIYQCMILYRLWSGYL